ncbi:hypothetical protein G6F64_010838 [Rhizopus arrhizus]|uniref:Uncharacterized protein n=1 Tax=Rhizopus oryzae TaxID=64495 RepID=A0A9P6X0V9_RHIOR|nr:hypothetical protein G6F64_010838 [Rhizopus arrhizus]
MLNKRKPTDTSEAQFSKKKTRINGLRKDYKFLPWVESSFKKQSPELDYFSFAELFNGAEDATNANYMDLLLTLQSKQSNKVTNIAHAAQTTFAARRSRSTEFGNKYRKYWINRKDNDLRENIDEESRSAISSIQQLVHQDLLERVNNVFGTSSSSSHTSSFNATLPEASSSDATPIGHTFTEATSSDVKFSDTASYDVTLTDPTFTGTTFTADTSSEAPSADVTTSSLTTANDLTETLAQSIELASDCLAKLGVIDLSSDSVREILKTCTTEEENERILTSVNPKEAEISNDAKSLIKAIKGLKVLSSNNDIVELGWLERDYYSTEKTKWDGVLFHTNNHTISPGFVEFSGGVKDNTTLTKERRDVSKLYTKMIGLIKSYPSTVMFRIEHAAVVAPRTIRELVKFTDNIPNLTSWKNVVVAQIEQF